MTATLATVHPLLRAAVRERVQTVIDVDVSVTVTAASGVYTRATGSWITDGFAVGQEVVVTGVTGATGTLLVQEVQASTLRTSGTGSGSGTGRFVAGLPAGRAWEGAAFTPQPPSPFVSESFKAGQSNRRGAGASGVIEHAVTANFTIFYPALTGTLAIERMAGAMMAHFKPGTDLTRGAASARVQQVMRSDVMLDGEWLAVGVTVSMLAHTFD